MTLASGDRVYGHVRRYFPHHNIAGGRMDVGRRAVRAMVILTRASGGNQFYASLLKAIDAISSHHHVSLQNQPSTTTTTTTITNTMQTFLHQVHSEHSKLASSFQILLAKSPNAPMPNLVNFGLKNIEIKHPYFANVDLTKFIIPTTLLLQQQQPSPSQTNVISSSYDAPILPLLRCVGIAHTLRLLSALLCERRIVLVSSSTTKLTACINSLLSILSQGCLSWHYMYVPCLPPSMLTFLAAPMPYLIGLMSHYGSPQQLERIGGLGEVLVVYLDQNDFKIFGMSNPDLSIPDILTNEMMYDAMSPGSSQQYGHSYMHHNHHQQPQLSIADTLKTDLIKIMKEDKKTRNTAAATVTGSAAIAATKGKDLIKRGFGKLKSAAKKFSDINDNNNHNSRHNGEDPPGNETALSDPISINDLYAYNDGYDNQFCELEVRIAFTIFFLTYIGDMKQYLRPGNGTPSFDKELFAKARIKHIGEYEQSPMNKLSAHFKETQIFEQFVNSRINDVSQRRVFSPRLSPLFQLAVQDHVQRRLPFNNAEASSVVRRIAANRPDNECINVVSHVRSRAISLTSNSRHEATVASSMHKLVQECWECGVTLVEVMSVIWDRLRDSRGMQWKHGLYALQLLQELILHGPLAAVVEATDGLDKIRRVMKSYENMRNNAANDIRATAAFIYSLLVNRSRLFAMRRICAQKRVTLTKPIRLMRDPRFDVITNRGLRMHQITFKKLHALIKPSKAVVSGAVVGGGSVDLLGEINSEPKQIIQNQQQTPLLNLMDNTTKPVSSPPIHINQHPPANQMQYQGPQQQFNHTPLPPTHYNQSIPVTQQVQQLSISSTPIQQSNYQQGHNGLQQQIPPNQAMQYNNHQQPQPIPQKPTAFFDPFA